MRKALEDIFSGGNGVACQAQGERQLVDDRDHDHPTDRKPVDRSRPRSQDQLARSDGRRGQEDARTDVLEFGEERSRRRG